MDCEVMYQKIPSGICGRTTVHKWARIVHNMTEKACVCREDQEPPRTGISPGTALASLLLKVSAIKNIENLSVEEGFARHTLHAAHHDEAVVE